MKKLFVTLIVMCLAISALAALAALAAQEQRAWGNIQIKNGEQQISHMVHSVPVPIAGNGLRGTSAVMRLVCTPKDQPVIGVKWSALPEINTVTVQVDVDGRTFRKAHIWNTDGTYMHRQLNNTGDLVTAMKKGKNVTFKFTHEEKIWTTSYPLNGFTNALRIFDKSCKF